MNTSKLSAEEKEILIHAIRYDIEERKQNATGNMAYFEKFIKPYRTAIDLLEIELPLPLENKEREACISSVQQYKKHLYSRSRPDNSVEWWLEASSDQLQDASRIDLLNDVLYRFGYFRKTLRHKFYWDERYANRRQVLDKLIQSDLICLSETSKKTFDEIGFIYNNQELAMFHLRYRLDLNMNFKNHGNRCFEYCDSRFCMILQKEEAIELLKKVNKYIYPDNMRVIHKLLAKKSTLDLINEYQS